MAANNFYLVMEYLPGGDLYSLLQHLGSLDEDCSRNYAIQIVKALEFLRDSRIIHRDLKPDNILIDASGYLHLVDFGLSYDGLSPTQRLSKVGTPDYMAPEIVLACSHSFPADYWSFGVILFELLSGLPPFHGESEAETFHRIISAAPDWSLLEGCSPAAIDLIGRLLDPDPAARLGAAAMREIMGHPWFAGVDWDHVSEIAPVFVPEPIPPEVANSYFVERYHFAGNEDDIMEDIEFSERTAVFKMAEPKTDFNRVALDHIARANHDHANRLRPPIVTPTARAGAGCAPVPSVLSDG
jgi:serine/threonine protein kinase